MTGSVFLSFSRILECQSFHTHCLFFSPLTSCSLSYSHACFRRPHHGSGIVDKQQKCRSLNVVIVVCFIKRQVQSFIGPFQNVHSNVAFKMNVFHFSNILCLIGLYWIQLWRNRGLQLFKATMPERWALCGDHSWSPVLPVPARLQWASL